MSKSATVVVLCSAPWGEVGLGLEHLTTWSLSYTSRQTFDITGTTLEDTTLNNVLEPPTISEDWQTSLWGQYCLLP